MATPRAQVRLYGSSLPLSALSGLVLVAMAIAIAWALPEARAIVAIGVAGGLALAFLLARRRRAGEEEVAKPLHLRE